MKSTLFTIGLILCLFPSLLLGQVGINTTTPDSSSALEIESTDSGILIPRMTEVQRNAIANPVKGLLVFQNNAEEGFWYFDGSIWILIGANGEFRSDSGVIYNTTSIANDDFVVGSTSLDNIVGTNDDRRMFFDKARAAFRVGDNTTTSWDNVNIGSSSVAMGFRGMASGNFSVSIGRQNTVTSTHGVAIGRSNTVTAQSGTSFGFSNDVTGDFATTFGRDNLASGTHAIAGGIESDAIGINSIALGNTSESIGENAIALGRLNDADGLNSVAVGFTNMAQNEGSFAFGNQNTVSGVNAMAFGNSLTAPSFSEVAVGLFNKAYTPNSIIDFNDTDRVFSVGNGFRTGGVTTFSNALTVLKNGNTGIGVEQPTEKLVVDGTIDATSVVTPIIRPRIGETLVVNATSIVTALITPPIGENLVVDGQINPTSIVTALITPPIGENLVVDGKIKATDVNFSGLPVFADEAAASSLDTGDLYQTPTGAIRIKL